jgi:hypothetical protein
MEEEVAAMKEEFAAMKEEFDRKFDKLQGEFDEVGAMHRRSAPKTKACCAAAP